MSQEKSPMKPMADVVSANGTYKKDGEEKTRWLNCGTLFISEDRQRMALKIDAVPTSAEFKGWFNVFVKKRKESTIDQAKEAEHEDTDQQPIDLSEIPF